MSTVFLRTLRFSGSGFTSDKPRPSNVVNTQKYNILTFLPLTIMAELAKLLIIFYLFNGVVQAIPRFSTNSPLITLIPVSWCILIGMLLEGIADYRRRCSDYEFNVQELTTYDI